MKIANLAFIAACASVQPLAAKTGNPSEASSSLDVSYPGTMTLNVDATDTTRRIFRVEQTIPVNKSGPMTLLFPKWLPGSHAPVGDVANLAGLTITANGQTIPWKRDAVDMHAFHIDVPAGASQINATFQYLSTLDGSRGRVTVTREMMSIKWPSLSLYPAGYHVGRIPTTARVTYPSGWRAGTALRPAATSGDTVTYETVPYETLIDSPVFAGKYFRSEALDSRVTLNIIGDDPKNLEITQTQITLEKNLVSQLTKLFGVRHYDRYDFLLAVSDKMGEIGLEHHRSSENQQFADFFEQWDYAYYGRYLLAHEMIHSWNGKHRRPADMVTSDYSSPTPGSLLWVYEGQTQFWTMVAAARSGLVSKEEALDTYAFLAGGLDIVPGRKWRSLDDTTNDNIIEAVRSEKEWLSWQRDTRAYYQEPIFLWLEVDAIIRAQTNGKKSMDDFARAFFGGKDGDYSVSPYTFDDIVSTLDQIAPYDWAKHLNTRLTEKNETPPFAGFKASGYELVYTDKPTNIIIALELGSSKVDLSHTLGLTVGSDGMIANVIWESLAFKAGIVPGGQIVSVNGKAFSPDIIKAAITEAKGTIKPIGLRVKSDGQEFDANIAWNGGLRYPHLIKNGTAESGLDKLLKPLK